ncbi:MAG TPA: lyase family protein [Vicinamibacterales bacterium]|nr:lyase family protein [Vicinamibacterales bacterium]
MTSEGLFSGVFSRGDAAAAVSDDAWLQAMLDFEVALARACARAELISGESAAAIERAATEARFDPVALGRSTTATGNPVVGLLRAMRTVLDDDAGDALHFGATSQDVIDSAAMLVTKRALEPILDDAAMAAACAAALAERHRETHMIGRTLLQQALPTTFGVKAAGWLSGIDLARRRLAATADECLAVQFGGAVGTLEKLGDRGPSLLADLALELELAEPPVPWHVERVRIVALADASATLGGAFGKVGRDVSLLAQNEIGELREGGETTGESSTMAHKRNPVAAVAIVACAQRLPGLVATMHAAMPGELERGAGVWQSEWGALSDLLRLAGSAASWGRELLQHLEVDRERMSANLAEARARIGASDAAARTGSAGAFIDRALTAHRGEA